MEINITWSVYIITNKPNGVLYIGESKRLKKRIY
ncbi:GIY-YIG nuclease family protein [Gelidibacter gilvus]|nr:GIY-YIG nuclease family protein [Gelidibacter gilvus]